MKILIALFIVMLLNCAVTRTPVNVKLMADGSVIGNFDGTMYVKRRKGGVYIRFDDGSVMVWRGKYFCKYNFLEADSTKGKQ